MKRRTEGAEASRQALSALIIRFCMLILTGQSYGQGCPDKARSPWLRVPSPDWPSLCHTFRPRTCGYYPGRAQLRAGQES